MKRFLILAMLLLPVIQLAAEEAPSVIEELQ